MNSTIQDLNRHSDNLVNSNYTLFTNNLKQFLAFVSTSETFKKIEITSTEEFEAWYENQRKTNNGLIGSGVMSWPEEEGRSLSLRLALLESVADGKFLTVPHFCEDFMWSENNFDTMTYEFNEQIVRPVVSDLRNYYYAAQTWRSRFFQMPNWKDSLPCTLAIAIVGGIVTSIISKAL